jgi:hypothetical protein
MPSRLSRELLSVIRSSCTSCWVRRIPRSRRNTGRACVAAYQITGERQWAVAARRCFEWFLGCNVLGKTLYDYQTGGCRDGLHGDHVNQNEGSESTLAWLMSLQATAALDQVLPGSAPPERSPHSEPAQATAT